MSEGNTINKVILFGKINKAPRVHKNEDGRSMICFTLATTETHLQNGQPVEQTEYHSVKLSESKMRHDLMLGQWVHVEGKIKTSSFCDEMGIRRYKTEVIGLRLTAMKFDEASVIQAGRGA